METPLLRNDSKCFENLPLGFYSGIVKCEIPPVHRSRTKQILFRSKHHCWEKDPPISFKTPLLGQWPILFIQNPTVERRAHLVRSKPHCWQKTLPLSFKPYCWKKDPTPFVENPTVGRRSYPFRSKPHCWEDPSLCSKHHCWEKDLTPFVQNPTVGRRTYPFRDVCNVFASLSQWCFWRKHQNLQISNRLLVGTLKEINFLCSSFST